MIASIGLTGLGIYALTELFKFLQKRFGSVMKTKLVVGVLVVIAGAIYYYFQQYQPDLLQKISVFVIGAFGISQTLWMLLEGYLPKEKPVEIKEV